MNNKELNEILKEIDTEDFIWIIYIGIILLSFYSNHLERDFYINKNESSKELYTDINIIIFTIAVLVYIYFFKGAVKSYKSSLKKNNNKKIELNKLSMIASGMFLIAGIIILYVAINNRNMDVELAFN